MQFKPVVFIASPYSKGDPAMNAHFQCVVFDRLLSDGIVLPVAPLWSHFQHMVLPRPYEDWIEYDQAMLSRYDACLRLDAVIEQLGYRESRSKGADNEAETFLRLGKPVFFDIETLYDWAVQNSKSKCNIND